MSDYYKLIIFDKDGTLVKELPDPQLGTRPANTPSEQELLPTVLGTIRMLKSNGCRLAIASNQGGVSWGFISMAQAYDLMNDVVNKLEGLIDEFLFCPFDQRGPMAHEYSSFAYLRKPEPGMLNELMWHSGVSQSETLYVGDRDSDRIAADAAGVAFEYAEDFFGWSM